LRCHCLRSSRPALAAAYPPPNNGWAYLFQGDGVASSQTSSLDGTWNRQNSLDAWTGDGRGAGDGAIGGISTSNGILTIEDALASGSGYDNRRFYFTHDLAQDAGVNNATTLLDDGVTITFRARLTPPTDPLLELAGVATGWVNNGDGKGIFGIHQPARAALPSASA
jgi:hypothetical protein